MCRWHKFAWLLKRILILRKGCQDTTVCVNKFDSFQTMRHLEVWNCFKYLFPRSEYMTAEAFWWYFRQPMFSEILALVFILGTAQLNVCTKLRRLRLQAAAVGNGKSNCFHAMNLKCWIYENIYLLKFEMFLKYFLMISNCKWGGNYFCVNDMTGKNFP